MDMHSKVLLTQARIIEFYGGYHEGMEYGGAYVSFSGGKDSTVLLHIARQIYPDIPAVFSNTGLEYPEIRRFAKAHDNVETVQPKIPYNEVISTYGYPLIGKEVAEAIYYARKIRSQDVQVERERERAEGQAHRNERSTEQAHDPHGRIPAVKTGARKRKELEGIPQRSGQNSRGRETTAKRADEPG